MPGSPPRPPFPWRGWLAALIVLGVLIWSALPTAPPDATTFQTLMSGTGFSLPELFAGMPDMIEFLGRMLPSAEKPWQWRYWPEIQKRLLETLKIAFAASVVGSALALPFVLVGTRPLAANRWVYNLSRGFLNLLRTIPDLVLASLLVAALSLGPLPGLIALIFFTFGVVAKLLADTVETVDPGPMEAISAAGGTRLQRALFGVLPQVAPDAVAYSLYAFEINVRVAAVLGLVGAGGIGQTLNTDINLLRYGRVGMIIAAMFVVVLIIDSISTWLRSKLV